MLALHSASLSFNAPAFRPAVAPAAVSMRQSEALPFLEAPPQLDGSMAGDVVRARSDFYGAVHGLTRRRLLLFSHQFFSSSLAGL